MWDEYLPCSQRCSEKTRKGMIHMKKYMAYLAAMLMLGSLTCCQQQEDSAPELLEPVGVKVDAAPAQFGDIYTISVYDGEVMPYVEELYFSVDGRLAELTVSIGDTVQQGQVLAVLDDEEIREQLENLEEQIAYTSKLGEFDNRRMTADINIAWKELEILQEDTESTYAELRSKEIEIQQLQTKLEQAQQLRLLSLENLTAQLENLRKELAGVQLTAPFAGQIVYADSLQKGDSIESFVPILCIADENRLYITAQYIPEYAITGADKLYAEIAGKQYPVSYLPMDTSEYLSLVLSGEELKTRFSFDQMSQELESGQFASITILDSYKEDALLIPANALYRDEQGRYVYKIADGKRIRQDVTVGAATNIEAEIIEGLQEGDIVYVKE